MADEQAFPLEISEKVQKSLINHFLKSVQSRERIVVS